MYTNMEFDELLSAAEDAYINADKSVNDIPYPEVSDLVFLIKTILENNYFEFTGKYYKQTLGCSMGSPLSPELADMRMYKITDYIMAHFERANQVIFHGRYRDDGFIIFDGTQEQILQFFNIGNTCHTHLKFTFEISDTAINFLDTTVYKGLRFKNRNTLDIKSYIKETNNFQYRHRDSAHSQAVFKGFIKGECIRHIRNTSDETLCNDILLNFKTHLHKRGYSDIEIDPIIEQTKTIKRTTIVHDIKTKSKPKLPTVMVTKYNPCIKGLKKRLLKYWNEMKAKPDCTNIFYTEPIVSFSKHKSIGDMIIKSK